MTLSSVGELSRFSGFDVLPQIEINPSETLERESYVNEVRYMFRVLPDGPVAEGGTWTNDYTIRETDDEGGLTTIDVSLTFSLVGETVLNGIPCLEIDAETSVTIKGQGTMRGTPFTMNMSGAGSGKIYFAHERGMLLEIRGSTRAEGSIESSVMTIPVVSEIESSLEVSLQ
jgi:hypothetical protein